MVTQSKIADISIRQGDRPTALTAYRLVLEINEAIFRRDPGNTEWQRDLSVSHNKIGDVLVAQGDRAGALDAYRDGLAIAERWPPRPRQHRVAARPLGQPHRIGDVLVAQGELRRARSTPTATASPSPSAGRAAIPATPSGSATSRSATTRSATCWWRRASATGALNAYRGGLAIARAAGRRDPGNTEWQRDLSVSHNKIGDVLVAQGELDGRARRLPRRPRHRRAAGPPRSRQHRVAARPLGQPDRIGDVLVAQGDGTGALDRLPRQPRHPRGAGRAAIPATPSGSAI